jgi:hypothetical protein
MPIEVGIKNTKKVSIFIDIDEEEEYRNIQKN